MIGGEDVQLLPFEDWDWRKLDSKYCAESGMNQPGRLK